MRTDLTEQAQLSLSQASWLRTYWPRILLFLSAALFIGKMAVFCRSFWPFTLDDAFITLRYSKHLAQGHGPAWNVNGPPQEGYTTVLWMVWSAVGEALGHGLIFAKASGVAFAIASVFISSRMAFRCAGGGPSARHIAAAVPLLLATAYWPLALHAVSGMETACSALALTLLMQSSIPVVEAPTVASSRRFAALAFVATLARPEMAVAGGAAAAVCCLRLHGEHRRTFLKAMATFCVAPGAIYFAARWLYFGLPFPLSFYVKAVHQPALAGLPDILSFWKPFVTDAPWWLGLMILGGGTRSLHPSLVATGATLLFFLVPSHIMAFEGRYLTPLVPFLTVLAGVGASKLASELERRLRLPSPAAWMFLALAGSALLPFPRPMAQRSQQWIDYGLNLERAHVRLAEDLRSSRAVRSIALLDVGAVGYYADAFTIDTFGLNDARVARSNREDIPYVVGQRPSWIVVVSQTPNAYVQVFDWEQPLYAGATSVGYRPVCSYAFEQDYHLLVLSRGAERCTQATWRQHNARSP